MMIDEENRLISILIGKISQKVEGYLEGYIAMIVVREDFRGKGIGKILVERFKKDVLKEGCY